MKLIAHRGWSEGRHENSRNAFGRAARHPAVDGVEFDVRRHGADRLIVSHDRPAEGADILGLEEALACLAGTDLELFIELKDRGIGSAVLDRLGAAGLAGRSTVFAFPEAAASMPWNDRRDARLGIIVPYPWQAPRLVAAYRPDALLLGWDERLWTRVAFRAWWSVASLRKLGDRSSADVVVGIVRRASDLAWLRRQGIEAAVADMDAAGLAPVREGR